MGLPWPTDRCAIGVTDDDASPIEQKTGVPHAVLRRFYPYQKDLVDTTVRTMSDRGRLMFVSFKPNSGVTWKAFADGRQDAWLRKQRELLEAFRHNIVVCPFPEPESRDESERYGGGVPRERLGPIYSDAFSHVAEVLAAGLDHVRMSWCLTGGWMDELAQGDADWVAAYWPDDEAVDYVASDPYVWCPGSGHGDSRPSFTDRVRGVVRFGRDKRKRVALPEFADYVNANRPTWIRGIREGLEKYPRIDIICWFSNLVECDFRLQDGGSIVAWRELLGSDVAMQL